MLAETGAGPWLTCDSGIRRVAVRGEDRVVFTGRFWMVIDLQLDGARASDDQPEVFREIGFQNLFPYQGFETVEHLVAREVG